MDALEVALALAISMLLFSTLVSMVLEMIYRARRYRRKVLEAMLASFYRQTLVERWGKALPNVTKAMSGDGFSQHVLALSGNRHYVSVTTLVERLADSPLGDTMATYPRLQLGWMLQDIIDRYQVFGHNTSNAFKVNSRRWTVGLSVLAALIFNINAVVLVDTYQRNSVLADSAMSGVAQVLNQASLQTEGVEAANHNAEGSIFNQANTLHDMVQQVSTLGLPIGWSEYSMETFRSDLAMLSNPAVSASVTFFLWLLSTVLTGLLIGLGGPFWFDLLKQLAGLRRDKGESESQKILASMTVAANHYKPTSNRPDAPIEVYLDRFLWVINTRQFLQEMTEPATSVNNSDSMVDSTVVSS